MKLIRRFVAILLAVIGKTLRLLWAVISNTAVFLFFVLAAMGGVPVNRSSGSRNDAYNAQANALRQAQLNDELYRWDD